MSGVSKTGAVAGVVFFLFVFLFSLCTCQEAPDGKDFSCYKAPLHPADRRKDQTKFVNKK